MYGLKGLDVIKMLGVLRDQYLDHIQSVAVAKIKITIL